MSRSRCRSPHSHEILYVEDFDEAGAALFCLRCSARFHLNEDDLIASYTHFRHTNGEIGPEGDIDLFLLDTLLRG